MSNGVLENVASPSSPRRPKSGALSAVSLTYWLVPLVGIALVLWASYAATTGRRISSANGVSGELLSGHSVGQSFIARYQNLSGVEVNIGTYRESGGPLRASLILHLRRGPLTDGPTKTTPVASEDLATVRLPAGYEVGVNPWYLFSFPPIASSQDKPFYVEVESPDGKRGSALTLFWWLPTDGASDPYPYGNAFLDGHAHAGDLAFGLRYSPAPLDVWAQLVRAASANMPAALMVVLSLALITGLLWASICLPRILKQPARRGAWLRRWSLPLALAVGLLNGLLYMSLVPPWQGPDENSHFTYAALLYRLDLDDRRVQAPDMRVAADAEKLEAVVAASMSRHNFTRYVSWHSAPGAPVGPDPNFFQELRQPPLYYWLCAAALREFRTLGFQVDPYTNPDGALTVMRGVSLALSLVVVALAWASGALLARGGGRGHGQGHPRWGSQWLRLLLPLGVALFPMRAFADSTANNDVLAELAVSALFLALVALLRWPTGWRGVALAMLAVALTAAGLPTKSTAPAASVPLLALGLLVWLGVLLTRFNRWWRDRSRDNLSIRSSRAQALVLPCGMAVAVLLGVVALLLSAFEQRDEAVGWHASFSPNVRVDRLASTTAHEGSYVIELGAPGGASTVSQALLSLAHHPAMRVTLSGWGRLSLPLPGVPGTPVTATAASTVQVQMTLKEGQRLVAGSALSLSKVGVWTPITVSGNLSESADNVLVMVTAGGSPTSPVQIDDFSLKVIVPEGPSTDPASMPTLVNPSGEEASVTLSPWASRLLPSEAREIADVVANPQLFSKGALVLYSTDMQQRSFWGLFGWVSIPLPDALFAALSALALLALCGLIVTGVHRWGRWVYQEWLALVSVGALAGAVAIGFAKQMASLATLNSAAYPQGRYLFVLIIPVMWLLIVGLHALWSRLGVLILARSRRISLAGTSVPGSRTALPWGILLLTWVLILFNFYSLFAVITPYFYG